MEGPSAKIARVTGSEPGMEAMFLEEVRVVKEETGDFKI